MKVRIEHLTSYAESEVPVEEMGLSLEEFVERYVKPLLNAMKKSLDSQRLNKST